MKNLFASVAILFLLAGCASFNKSVFDGGISVTATVQNPITLEQQAGVELSAAIARKAVLAYAQQPRCLPGAVAPTCSYWPAVQKMKDANRIANQQLINMREFLDNNKQVSAIAAFNAAVKALRDLRASAYVVGVEIKEGM